MFGPSPEKGERESNQIVPFLPTATLFGFCNLERKFLAFHISKSFALVVCVGLGARVLRSGLGDLDRLGDTFQLGLDIGSISV